MEELEPVCESCSQRNVGQSGEYPCAECGLPQLHDEEFAGAVDLDHWEKRILKDRSGNGHDLISATT